MKKLLSICLLLWLGLPVFAQMNALDAALFGLPDVIFEQIETPRDYEAAYVLRIKQPLDHQNPDKGHFYQRVWLSHKGFDKFNVIVTEGYQRNGNRIYELSQLLEANQIDVEHRYFGESMPEKLDYQYLTLEQATADLHHVREVLGKIYQEKWISTGISKGGQTTIFYRYFFPEDVAVSVPYVAPLNLEFEEKRIYTFLDTVGSDECRAAILGVQKRLLKERKEVLQMLKWYSKGAKLSFDYLGFEEAFEYTILEYPFSFWQWGASCEDIPGKDAPLEEVLDHMLAVSGLDFFSDEQIAAYGSHYYQAATQMGYYGYETKPFKGLLKALPMQPHPHAAFVPNKMEVAFDGSLLPKVAEWLKTEGNNFIYINGASDTWSAPAVPPSDATNSLWFNLAGKDHGGARIRNMSREQVEQMGKAFKEWLEIE
ncbi:MAG: S28 family serine protease [Bacteroidota bacterium]